MQQLTNSSYVKVKIELMNTVLFIAPPHYSVGVLGGRKIMNVALDAVPMYLTCPFVCLDWSLHLPVTTCCSLVTKNKVGKVKT